MRVYIIVFFFLKDFFIILYKYTLFLNIEHNKDLCEKKKEKVKMKGKHIIR